MHSLIGCGIIAFAMLSGGAGAQEQTEASQKLNNLVFYTHARQFHVSAEVQSSATSTGEVDNNLGAYSNSVITYTRIGAAATYGVFDRFRMGVSVTQLIEQDNVSINYVNGNAGDQISRGLSDPTVYAGYRVLENPEHHIYSDINLKINTSFGPQVLAVQAPSGNWQQTGNYRTGAWQLQLSAPLYLVKGRHEFGVTPVLLNSLTGHQVGLEDRNTRTLESYWSASMSFADRIHLTDAFFLQPIINLQFPYSYLTTSKESSPTINLHEQPLDFSPELLVGYLITPSSMLDFSISYNSYISKIVPSSGSEKRTTRTLADIKIRTSFTF
jgi:hypothetical protein